MTKSDRKIMEILEAFDLTRCAHSAAQLSGVDEKTVAYAELGISDVMPNPELCRSRLWGSVTATVFPAVVSSSQRPGSGH